MLICIFKNLLKQICNYFIHTKIFLFYNQCSSYTYKKHHTIHTENDIISFHSTTRMSYFSNFSLNVHFQFETRNYLFIRLNIFYLNSKMVKKNL